MNRRKNKLIKNQIKKVFYYKKWYATLTDEEKKEEENCQFNERIVESVHRGKWTTDCVEVYEKIENELKSPPPQKPSKVKSIISILDDSSDEEGEVKSKPVNTKEHKIMKALECDSLGFLD